ncbi:hypothetical protein NFI96_017974 [Prochilodus magdalenae]|nr:hypothetical protein NFI96_017974 [Prochilodus magdalenae]
MVVLQDHSAPWWSCRITLLRGGPAGSLCCVVVLQDHSAPWWSCRITLLRGGPAGSLCSVGVLQDHCASWWSCRITLLRGGPAGSLCSVVVLQDHSAPWWSCRITLLRGGPAGSLCSVVVLQDHSAPWWSCRITLLRGGPAGSLCCVVVLQDHSAPWGSCRITVLPGGPAGSLCSVVVLQDHSAPWWSCRITLLRGGPAGSLCSVVVLQDHSAAWWSCRITLLRGGPAGSLCSVVVLQDHSASWWSGRITLLRGGPAGSLCCVVVLQDHSAPWWSCRIILLRGGPAGSLCSLVVLAVFGPCCGGLSSDVFLQSYKVIYPVNITTNTTNHCGKAVTGLLYVPRNVSVDPCFRTDAAERLRRFRDAGLFCCAVEIKQLKAEMLSDIPRDALLRPLTRNEVVGMLVRLTVFGAATYYSIKWVVEALDPTQKQKSEAKKRAERLMKQMGVEGVTLNEYEMNIATHLVDPRSMKVTWRDVAGLDDIITEMQDTVILPFQKRHLFRGSKLVQPPRGVLLYGPPGCGKTLIAKATAKASGCQFINLQASTLTDKWYGESQKLTAAVFSLAVKLQPCIIFIDEIDSFLRNRSSLDHEATAMMKAQFMSLWDGLETAACTQVMVMGATNRPQDVDAAILRRMPAAFHVGLPVSTTLMNTVRCTPLAGGGSAGTRDLTVDLTHDRTDTMERVRVSCMSELSRVGRSRCRTALQLVKYTVYSQMGREMYRAGIRTGKPGSAHSYTTKFRTNFSTTTVCLELHGASIVSEVGSQTQLSGRRSFGSSCPEKTLGRKAGLASESGLGLSDLLCERSLLGLSNAINLKEIAQETEGYSGSDLRELCRDAAMYRVRDYVRKQQMKQIAQQFQLDEDEEEPVDGVRLRPVTQLDLLFGLDKMKESKQATAAANLREVPLD